MPVAEIRLPEQSDRRESVKFTASRKTTNLSRSRLLTVEAALGRPVMGVGRAVLCAPWSGLRERPVRRPVLFRGAHDNQNTSPSTAMSRLEGS